MNQSINKAFNLLNYFTTAHPVWGVRELASKSGYNKSTVYRLLQSLCDIGVIYQDRYDKYQLGYKLFELGKRVSSFQAIQELVQPSLNQIAQLIDESVLFSIPNPKGALCIAQADSNNGLKLENMIGQYQPLYASAPGKLFLAQTDLSWLDKNKMESFTEKTIVDYKCLQEQLIAINTCNFALDIEEIEEGLVCLALPIKNKFGATIGAISACGPSSRFRTNKVNSYIEIMSPGQMQMQAALADMESISVD